MFQLIRAVLTALVTPIWWSRRSGHFRSSLRARSVDRNGLPLPWYTYPAIDFLRSSDVSACSVLEFGAGQSTLWWASRVKHVLSLEGDRSWYNQLRRRLPENVELRLVPNDPRSSNPMPGRSFDVVIVDGLDRLVCAQLACELVAEHGAVIVDNSEGHWGGDSDRTHPIIDLFHAAGFQRVDFYGQAPGVILPHCTSLFFREDCFLLRNPRAPRVET